MRSARVGELVQDEDAAVRSREHSVVDRQLVGEVSALGDLDRIHLADQVGDRDVGRGEFSPYRRSLGSHSTGARSPSSATSARPALLIGSSGSSLTSLPVSADTASSRSATSDRARRFLASPRSPSRIRS